MTKLFPFATEHLLDESQAKEITRPIWPDLTRVWVSAWREWGSVAEEHRARLSQTPFVPPIMIFGFAQSFAKEVFLGRENEGIIQCDELFVFGFYLDKKLLLRFNAVDSDFIVRNSQNGSDRKDQYFRQEPIAGLDNAATRLTVGYVPNAAKTELASVVLSCQVGDDLYYSFRIDGTEDTTVSIASPTQDPQPDYLSEQLTRKKPK